MGFFDRFLNQEKGAQLEEISAPAAQADERDDAPVDILQYRQHECVEVRGTEDHQDILAMIDGDTVEVKVRKLRQVDGYAMYSVSTIDDELLGELTEYFFKKAGIPTRGTVAAEIARPIYRNENAIALFIPISDKEKERQAAMDDLKFWTSLDASKWLGEPIDDREDYYNGEILVREFEGKKKPTLSVVADGRRLFSVSSRMKMYDDLMNRRYFDIRHLIVEKRESNNGTFYRVGFYF